MMSHSILRSIADRIRALLVLQFSIIVDGTQDISGTEQESICLRYVDQDLVPQEVFMGLYQTNDTTGRVLANIALDALTRLNLPLASLRGQTYDGASNMSAVHVHCGAHCINLVTQKACSASILIRDALDWVNQLGVLCSQSGKFKTLFKDIASSNPDIPCTAIRPLCPTRWTVRGKAILAVLAQYESVLEQFGKGKTLLGLVLASSITGDLESLNISLQCRTGTVSGMRAAVECVSQSFQVKRSEVGFHSLFERATQMVQDLDLEPINLPRSRQPPKRFTGQSEGRRPNSAEEHYRAEYFEVLDLINAQLKDRFQQGGLLNLESLENTLLTGQVSSSTEGYPELNHQSLSIQLPMFLANYKFSSVAEAAQILRGLPVQVRSLFGTVETLIRLLLVVPISTAEAERSFSALRRLKTWLRSTGSAIEEACEVLQPYEEVTVEISGEGYVTASKISILVRGLQRLSASHLRTGRFKQPVVVSIEFNSLLSESSILDPRFKRKTFSDDQAANDAIQRLTNAAAQATISDPSQQEALMEQGAAGGTTHRGEHDLGSQGLSVTSMQARKRPSRSGPSCKRH
ncbi:Zinc finger MYM-type protein 1 [Merluccius polli]|uniref:Zinc finger MYM-type protein 1 n=1 Tax=Merluccius polli TaxID=89951 RepID=A0AA47P4Q5_MERPO|nr:Zinc finger MYM-type protein 1 [Merluccius polli]